MNPPGWEDSDSSDSDGTDGSGDFQVGNEHAVRNELMDRLESMRQSFRIAELRASHMNIRQVHNTYGSLHSVSSPDGMIHTYHNPVTNQNIVIRQPRLVQIAAQSDDGVTQSTEANRMVEAMQPSMPGSAREVWPASGGPEAGSASGGPVPSLELFKLVPSTLENGLLAYALEYTDT